MTPAIDAHRLRKLAQTAAPVIRDYDLHPPDDLRLFPMPKAGVLRFNDDVFVAEVRHDEDEFEDAIARGLLGAREQAGARDGLDELIDLIDRHALVDFVAEVHPFGPTNVPEAPAMKRVELSEAGLLRPGVRASW
jgi:hypothetical protein